MTHIRTEFTKQDSTRYQNINVSVKYRQDGNTERTNITVDKSTMESEKCWEDIFIGNAQSPHLFKSAKSRYINQKPLCLPQFNMTWFITQPKTLYIPVYSE